VDFGMPRAKRNRILHGLDVFAQILERREAVNVNVRIDDHHPSDLATDDDGEMTSAAVATSREGHRSLRSGRAGAQAVRMPKQSECPSAPNAQAVRMPKQSEHEAPRGAPTAPGQPAACARTLGAGVGDFSRLFA